MKTNIYLKIMQDPKQLNFLYNHSYWYKELNRTPDNYKNFEKEYKETKKKEFYKKTNSFIDTIDTASKIISIMK